MNTRRKGFCKCKTLET